MAADAELGLMHQWTESQKSQINISFLTLTSILTHQVQTIEIYLHNFLFHQILTPFLANLLTFRLLHHHTSKLTILPLVHYPIMTSLKDLNYTLSAYKHAHSSFSTSSSPSQPFSSRSYRSYPSATVLSPFALLQYCRQSEILVYLDRSQE